MKRDARVFLLVLLAGCGDTAPVKTQPQWVEMWAREGADFLNRRNALSSYIIKDRDQITPSGVYPRDQDNPYLVQGLKFPAGRAAPGEGLRMWARAGDKIMYRMEEARLFEAPVVYQVLRKK